MCYCLHLALTAPQYPQKRHVQARGIIYIIDVYNDIFHVHT